MNKEEIVRELKEKKLTDILELLEDAENGNLVELELVKQVGLLYDTTLNEKVIKLLESYNVEIIYVTDDEDI